MCVCMCIVRFGHLLLLLIKTIVGTSLVPCIEFYTGFYDLNLSNASQRSLVILFTLYLSDHLCICVLVLLNPFLACVCLERKHVFKKNSRSNYFAIYNAVLLGIWFWYYSLTSVISLCLKLLIQIAIHQRRTPIQKEYSV